MHFKRLLTSIIHTSNFCTGSSFLFCFKSRYSPYFSGLDIIFVLLQKLHFSASNKVYMNCVLCLCFLQHFNAWYYSCMSKNMVTKLRSQEFEELKHINTTQEKYVILKLFLFCINMKLSIVKLWKKCSFLVGITDRWIIILHERANIMSYLGTWSGPWI